MSGPPPGATLPPAVVDAFREAHISRSQADVCGVLFSGILYGILLPLFFQYFALFWRNHHERGLSKDGVYLRWLVVVLFLFTTGFLGVTVAVGQTLWVTVLAILFYAASSVAFLVACVYTQKEYNGDEVSLHEINVWVAVGIWTSSLITIFTASVLIYVLGWQRRDRLAQSSKLNALLELSIRSSIIIMIFNIIGGVGASVSLATGELTGLLTSIVTSKLYAFSSVACLLFSLLARHTSHLDDRPTHAVFLPGGNAVASSSTGSARFRRRAGEDATLVPGSSRRYDFSDSVSVQVEVEERVEGDDGGEKEAEEGRKKRVDSLGET
ncbi:hypothetical protein JCM8547_004847 [Rhodosporidiobolus lusitaniae]